MQGVQFKLHGAGLNRYNQLVSRGQVVNYHCKPHPVVINKSAHRVDIAGLKRAEQRDVITFDGTEYSSRFTLGIEVEKNSLHRNAVREYPLLCGFERDASCGYEAVSHILPLLPAGQWRTKVFDLFVQAEKIIDDRYSPSNSDCGGHMTIGVECMTGDDLREAVRKFSGVVMALFRKRLRNRFCNKNLRMQGFGDPTGYFNGWDSKYQMALVKDNCLEFRVVARFQSVKQVMRRYELMYELVNFAINNPNGSFDSFLKRVTPIILSMYNGDTDKANEVLDLSKKFQKFINVGAIHPDIAQYI
jgi:hypothetical protein